MADFNGVKNICFHTLLIDAAGTLDASGQLVIQYRYDAWGKLLTTSTLTSAYTTPTNLNPLRYRGYMCDTETGYTYIRSDKDNHYRLMIY